MFYMYSYLFSKTLKYIFLKYVVQFSSPSNSHGSRLWKSAAPAASPACISSIWRAEIPAKDATVKKMLRISLPLVLLRCMPSVESSNIT